MNDKLIQVILSGKSDKLVNALKEGGKHVEAFGTRTMNALSRANKSIVAFSDKYIGTMAKLGIGVGGVALAKNVMEFNSALARFGRDAGMNQAQVAKLKQGILDLGQAVPLTKGELLDMTKNLEGTGIAMDMVNRILPDTAKGAVASGANVEIYGDTIGELMDKLHIAEKDLPGLQDRIQKALQFEDVKKQKDVFLGSIKSLANYASVAKSFGVGSASAYLATQSVLMKSGQSLSGMYERLKMLGNDANLKNQLKSHGISLWDDKGNVKGINELLPQLVRLREEGKKFGKGSGAISAAVFGRGETAMAAQVIMDDYEKIIERIKEMDGAAGETGKRFQDAMQGDAEKLALFQNQLDKFNTEHMSRALGYLSTVLDYLNKHPFISTAMLTGLGLAGVLVFANKVKDAVGGLFGGGGGGGGAAGKGGGPGAPMPVYVVNFPGGFAGGGFGTRDVDFGGPAGKGGGLMSLLGKLGAVAGVATAGYAFGTGINSLIDMLYGEKGGLGSRIYDITHGGTQNNINLRVNVDKSGRVTTESDDRNTAIDVERGEFMLD